MTTLGIRQRNPGNLEPSNPPWQGTTGVNQRFVIFDTMENGVRALAKNLIAYQDRHGINTVRGAISRWAPPADNNDTNAYIAAVCHMLEVNQDDKLNFHDADTLYWLVIAIGSHENGHKSFDAGVSEDDLNAGIEAALA